MPFALQTTLGSLALTDWVAVVVSYLLGAMPFGLVMARLVKGIDLREFGSGNIGATNAIRALGRPLGLLVFLLDTGKGLIAAVAIAGLASGSAEPSLLLGLLCGGAAVVGHCFPVYLRFRGGKGVAAAYGVLLAVAPLISLLGGLIWVAVLLTTRYVGLASIAMGVSFPPLSLWLRGGEPELLVGTALLCVLILVRHRSNMARMIAGTEVRTGRKGRKGGPPAGPTDRAEAGA